MKKALTLVLFTFLALVSAATLLSNLSWADPYIYMGDVPPKPDTIPPKITIISPNNNAAYNTDYITLLFLVTGPTGPNVNSPIVDQIYYTTDWQQTNVTIYKYTSDPFSGYPTNGEYPGYYANLTLKGIPEGNHSIKVVAGYVGWYIPSISDPSLPTSNSFYITGSSMVNFTIADRTPPKILILSLENNTFSSRDVLLSFEVNESVSQLTYSLDGQMNVTIAGNTTLTGLSYGIHNLTVYATDTAGNTGVSEPITFTIAKKPEPFPAMFVIAVSVATVAIVSTAFLIYFKKHRH
jgi:hypothetical protein